MCVSPPNKKLEESKKQSTQSSPLSKGHDWISKVASKDLHWNRRREIKSFGKTHVLPPINSESISNRQQRGEGPMETGPANIAQPWMGWERLVMEPMLSMNMWSKTNYQNARHFSHAS
jgi:hypothetical protein